VPPYTSTLYFSILAQTIVRHTGLRLVGSKQVSLTSTIAQIGANISERRFIRR
jgi:hypothetical protein